MKIKIMIILFVTFLLAPVLASASVRTVHAEWDYNIEVSDLAGFNLYVNGVKACNVPDPTARSTDCAWDINDGQNDFSMTAYDANGNESEQSATFAFDPAPPAPGPLKKVTIIKTVTTTTTTITSP